MGSDDYSHGMFVPFISAFLAVAEAAPIELGWASAPSWLGPLVVLAGLSLYVVGNLATLYVISHLSLWLRDRRAGTLVSSDSKPLRETGLPSCLSLDCYPLPVFLYNALSSRLQLWSSALGVGVLQFIGVTAFREGNVIDLGPVQLQVAEACSGIRYLFPLTSLALLCAYFFRDRMWKRILLVLSALPISVLVNGFRIGSRRHPRGVVWAPGGGRISASLRRMGPVPGFTLAHAGGGNVGPLTRATDARCSRPSEPIPDL
jgi:exosortase